MSRRLFTRTLALLVLVLMLAGWAQLGAELAVRGTRVLLVSGTVRAADTGRTVRSAEVTLNFQGMGMRRAITDGGGHFELRVAMPDAGTLPSGQYELTARDRRYCGSTTPGFELLGVERTAVFSQDLTLTACPN